MYSMSRNRLGTLVKNQETFNKKIQEDLRSALQASQNAKLSYELQVQKRSLLQQQIQYLQQENEQLKQQTRQLMNELSKIKKKYSKLRRVLQYQCPLQQIEKQKEIQRQRSIYFKERQLLHNEIKVLDEKIRSYCNSQDLQRFQQTIIAMTKQLQLFKQDIFIKDETIYQLNKKIEDMTKERQQFVEYIEKMQERVNELQIDILLDNGLKKNNFQNIKHVPIESPEKQQFQ